MHVVISIPLALLLYQCTTVIACNSWHTPVYTCAFMCVYMFMVAKPFRRLQVKIYAKKRKHFIHVSRVSATLMSAHSQEHVFCAKFFEWPAWLCVSARVFVHYKLSFDQEFNNLLYFIPEYQDTNLYHGSLCN